MLPSQGLPFTSHILTYHSSRLSAFVIRVFSKGRHCGGDIDPKLLREGIEYLCKRVQVREGTDLGRFIEKHWWYLDYRQTWIKVGIHV